MDELIKAKAWCFDMGFSLSTDSTRDYDNPTIYNIWSDYDENGKGCYILDTWYSTSEDAILEAYKNKKELDEKYL